MVTGQRVHFKALIKNYGPDDLSNTLVISDYKVTYAYRWGESGSFTEWGGGEGGDALSSGSSEWRKEGTSLSLTRSGTLQVKVSVAENRSDTVETDSSDNTRTETYTVSSPIREKRVDLGVTDISYDGTLFYDGTLKQGQWVHFKALIKNYGPDDLSSNWLSSDYKVTYAYRWGAIGIFTEWGGGEGGNGLFSGSSEWRKESTSLWLTRSGTLQVKVSVAENRSDTV